MITKNSISEITSNLTAGDKIVIARIIGCDEETVSKAFNDQLPKDGELSKRIIKVAQKVIINRENFIAMFR